jgi:hypothetical protein
MENIKNKILLSPNLSYKYPTLILIRVEEMALMLPAQVSSDSDILAARPKGLY